MRELLLTLMLGGLASGAGPPAHLTAAERQRLERAATLNRVGYRLHVGGDHVGALPLMREALKSRLGVLGEAHPSTAQSLNNLAALYKEMGDNERALPMYTRAVKAWARTVGEDQVAFVAGLLNLAEAEASAGREKDALGHYRQALRGAEKRLGRRHYAFALALNNLGAFHLGRGEHDKAGPLFEEAAKAWERGLMGYYPSEVCGLGSFAGQSPAGSRITGSKITGSKITTPDGTPQRDPAYPLVLYNLGVLRSAEGKHKEALPLYEKARSLWAMQVGWDHPITAHALSGLAAHHLNAGSHDKARGYSEDALLYTFGALHRYAAVQSDRQQLLATALLRARLDVRLSIPDADKGPTAYRHVLRWKGAIFLRQQQRRLFARLSDSAEARAAQQRLRAASKRLTELARASDTRPADLERAGKEQEKAQAELSYLAEAAWEKHRPPAITEEKLAGLLPKDVALVDYCFYHRHGLRDKDGKPRTERRLTAIVSRNGKPCARVELGAAAPIEKAIDAWRAAVVGMSAKEGERGAELGKLIWAPLAKHLAGANTVLISPDEALGTVPFAALPGKKAGTYLVEDVALAIVPVPQALPALLKRPDKAERLKPSLLLVGGLRYDAAGKAPPTGLFADNRSAPRSAGLKFKELEGTVAEIKSVRGSFSDLFSTGTVTRLDRDAATKPAVRKALVSVRYAHFATHGYFTPEEFRNALSYGPRPV
jgi:tetratricopeptide (TPR) repeat protein